MVATHESKTCSFVSLHLLQVRLETFGSLGFSLHLVFNFITPKNSAKNMAFTEKYLRFHKKYLGECVREYGKKKMLANQ